MRGRTVVPRCIRLPRQLNSARIARRAGRDDRLDGAMAARTHLTVHGTRQGPRPSPITKARRARRNAAADEATEDHRARNGHRAPRCSPGHCRSRPFPTSRSARISPDGWSDPWPIRSNPRPPQPPTADQAGPHRPRRQCLPKHTKPIRCHRQLEASPIACRRHGRHPTRARPIHRRKPRRHLIRARPNRCRRRGRPPTCTRPTRASRTARLTTPAEPILHRWNGRTARPRRPDHSSSASATAPSG